MLIVSKNPHNTKQVHALWYIRVSDAIPVLKHKGILSIFEYSGPLHPPLRPFIQYWGTLMRDKFPVLNTLPKLDIFPIKSRKMAIFSTKMVIFRRNGQKLTENLKKVQIF